MDFEINLIYSTSQKKWLINTSGVTYSSETLEDFIPQIRGELKRQVDELRTELTQTSTNVEYHELFLILTLLLQK